MSVEEQDGRPWIVMEYVDGGALSVRLGQPWPIAQAVCLLEKLSLAVHSLHLRGAVHRNINPSQVLLTSQGDVKLAGFGRARAIDPRPMLSEAALFGEPGYMPPEQLLGTPIDHAAAWDIWSLGVLLYELLSGRRPFVGSSALETFERTTQQPAIPLSVLRPDVPRHLEKTCMKCLEKAPVRRYPSAQELAEELSTAGSTR